MSLFPFFGDVTKAEQNKDMPIYKEVAWDFERNIPRTENGEYKFVYGNEALKTWCFKALKTERFRYLIYSSNYGSEFETLLGKSYRPNVTKAECIRYLREALLINPYIKDVAEVEVEFEQAKLNVWARIITVYGEMVLEGRV